MGRIADILTRVRDSLADHDKSRWSDARLIRLIDEAQKDIAVKARLLRAKTAFEIKVNRSVYRLPEGAFQITRVIGLRSAEAVADAGQYYQVPIKTHAQMDLLDPAWETRFGDGIECVIFDKLNPRELKVYPIPKTAIPVVEGVLPNPLGVLASTDAADITSDEGVLASVEPTGVDADYFSSDFGVLTGIALATPSIIVYYNRRPSTVQESPDLDVSVSLEIDDLFDKAIKHYVVGSALRDDMDTQNRQVGNEELLLYSNELAEAMRMSAKDFTNADGGYMDYRRSNVSYHPGI